MPMQILDTEIAGAKVLRADIMSDGRGHFAETYRQSTLHEAGVDVAFVQENRAYSKIKGTVRGLHFQIPPHQQAKLISVLRGAIFDVAVDLRQGSPSFRRWIALELDAERLEQLYLPAGLAHGYCTLAADTEILYKVSAYYAPNHDFGVHWRDSDLAIRWPDCANGETLSPRDNALPPLSDLPDYFGECDLVKASPG